MRSHSMNRFRRPNGFSIFFLVVLVPCLLLGLGLASDAARIMLARQQASDVADNVAMAGATGIDSSNTALDTAPQGLAATRANDMFETAKTSGMLPASLKGRMGITTLTPNRISATVYFTVPDLIIFAYLGQQNSMDGSVTRSAGVCLSGDDSASCAYTGA